MFPKNRQIPIMNTQFPGSLFQISAQAIKRFGYVILQTGLATTFKGISPAMARSTIWMWSSCFGILYSRRITRSKAMRILTATTKSAIWMLNICYGIPCSRKHIRYSQKTRVCCKTKVLQQTLTVLFTEAYIFQHLQE